MYKRAMVYEKNTPNSMYGASDISHVYHSTNVDPSNNNVEQCSKLVYKYSNYTNKKYGATSQKSKNSTIKI